MLDIRSGMAARGAAFFALACLLAAALLLVRFRRPPEIVFEAMTDEGGQPGTLAEDAGAEQAHISEGSVDIAAAEQPEAEEDEEAGEEAGIYVHVAGCVAKPGLYGLKAGARVNDALLAAGGMTKSADADSVNIALPVRDGQQVYIPMRAVVQQPVKAEAANTPQSTQQAAKSPPQPSSEPAPPERLDVTRDAPDDEGRPAAAAPAVKVDINSAGAAELDTLPGIGPSTAAKIIEYRDDNGPFASIEQLMDVSGIGPAKFEAIKELVVLGR